MLKNFISNRENLVAFTIFAIIIFGILLKSGNITDGPRIVDDNQIYRLQIEFSNQGFLKTLLTEIDERINSYKRLFPVYFIHKVIEAKIFGINLYIWSIYYGFIALLIAFFLFLFGKEIKFSFIESLLFSLLIVYGVQSVIWWRLLQGESIGMLLLSLSLLFMAKSVNTENKQSLYSTLFVIFAILASLSKESFILVLPALVLWRIWLFYDKENLSLMKALKKNLYIIVIFAFVFLGELLFIKIILKTTKFSYAGWDGFNLNEFVKAANQFFQVANMWIPLSIFVLYVIPVIILSAKKQLYNVSKKMVNFILVQFTLFLSFIIPQILLYQKSGFLTINNIKKHVHLERYLLPGILGYSILTISLLYISRKYIKAIFTKFSYKNEYLKAYIHKTTRILLIIIIFLVLGARTKTIYSNAVSYSQYNQELGKWFNSITEHTSKKDNIVIVYQSRSKDLKIPLRVKFILNVLYDRHNLYFLHFPNPPVKFKYLMITYKKMVQKGKPGFFTDLARHIGSLKGIESLPDWNKITAIAILHSKFPLKISLEEHFKNYSEKYLNLKKYKKYSNKLGFITYYKKNK